MSETFRTTATGHEALLWLIEGVRSIYGMDPVCWIELGDGTFELLAESRPGEG